MDFKFNVNIDDIKSQISSFSENIEVKVQQAVQLLATQTHAKILELVQVRLRSTRRIYADNLMAPRKVNENTWIIELKEPAMWVEEGMSPHSMVDDLLKGREYRAIPIDQGKAPTDTPRAMSSLSETLRKELRKYKIPISKIERNPDGSPKLGLLHSLDVNSKEKGPTGTPYLHGLRIYQSMDKTGKTNRFVGTFRMVSKKHKAQGRWFHPGLEPKLFFDKAFQWAMTHWETDILPDLMKGLKE